MLAHSQKEPVLTRRLWATGAPPASEALSLAWSQGGPHGSGGGSSGSSGVSGPGPAQRQLLTQVLSFCRRQGEKGEGGRERGGGENEREGDSRREGGGRDAEVLKGTLTSFLGFPWQPNIPQMNISVREREEAEGGEDRRELETEMERDRGREMGRWGRELKRWGQGDRDRKMMGQERWRMAWRPGWRAGGSPPYPRGLLEERRAQGPQDFFQSPRGPWAGGPSN